MGFHLTRLEAAGFRGINRRLDLPLQSGLTVISGGNGAGKSSILQAVEWALLGALPESGNGEFRREDAIVNAFSSASRAQVRLTLADGAKTLLVERSRRLGRSTTPRSDLVLRSGGEVWRDAAAQDVLLARLCLTAAEYHSAVHVRQDASRLLASAEGEDRAATINRLLGIAALRELADNLALPQVSRELNRLTQEVATVRAAGLTTAMEMRRLLTQREEALRERHVDAVQLSERALESLLARVEADLTGGLTALGLTPAPWPRAPAARLAESRRVLVLCRTRRDERLRQLHEERSQLAVARALLGSPSTTLAEPVRSAVHPAGLPEELAAVEGQLAALRRRREHVQELQRQEQEQSAALQAAEAQLQQRSQTGAATAGQSLQRLERELAELTTAGRRQRSEGRLLNDAVDVLQGSGADRCPVCGQPIAAADVLGRIQRDLASNAEARRLEDLRQRYRRADEQRGRLLEEQAAVAAAQAEAASRRERLAAVRSSLRTAASPDGGEDALSPGALTAAIAALEDRRAELRLVDQQRANQERDDEARRLALATLTTLLANPAGATSSELVKLAQERTADLDGELAVLEQWGATAARLDADLQEAAAIADYLDLRAGVERLTAGLSDVDQRQDVLAARQARVQRLQTALQAIHRAATTLGEERLRHALDAVVPAANRYFDRLGGHPAYAALTLQPQMQRGSSTYALLAHDADLEHATFLPTRLSHTQMHVAALAMFLALGQRRRHLLDVLLLDDPAQSMDADRKRALAAVLAAEAQDRQVIVTTEDLAFQRCLVPAASAVARVLHLGDWSRDGVQVEG